VAEQRYLAVMAVAGDGLSIAQVAEKVGLSRQTLHTWLARYEAQGLDGLVDRSRRPAGSAADAGRGGGRFVGVAPIAAVSGTAAAGVRAGQTPDEAAVVVIGGLSDVGASRHVRPESAGSVLAQMETLGMRRPDGFVAEGHRGRFARADGTSAKALTGIDDHSRMCVGARLMAVGAPARCVRAVIAEFAGSVAPQRF
jgi:helix-turn-helix protein